MGLIGNLKMLWKNRKAIQAASSAVDNVKGVYVKSGCKTSEFWLTVLTNIATVVTALNGVLNPKTAAIILAVTNGLYAVLRTALKAQEPSVPPAETPKPPSA